MSQVTLPSHLAYKAVPHVVLEKLGDKTGLYQYNSRITLSCDSCLNLMFSKSLKVNKNGEMDFDFRAGVCVCVCTHAKTGHYNMLLYSHVIM